VKRGWAFISPEFRGPNDKPEACASAQARQDVLDAVDYMVRRGGIDERRIYLLGGSGGGHMALVMAAHAPKRWRAVSAWVPITDLAAWHAESVARGAKYAAMMEKCCGGKPDDAAAREQYRLRSPLPFLAAAQGLPIAIETGISDGHSARPGPARPANWGGSVPVSHSLRAFNALAEANGYPREKLAEAEIRFITEKAELPEHLKMAVAADEIRKHGVAFRRAAGPVVLTLFMGGHETDFEAALNWLAGK
jgi:acetyl esterase/lipase